jgi:hypothetical protein
MARATDRSAFLRIVEEDYPHLRQVHSELLDRLELPSNRSLGIRLDFHGEDAKTPTYHVYVDPPGGALREPYSHALRVHTGGIIYVVWKGNVPERLAEQLHAAFEGLVKTPHNLDGSQVQLGDEGTPFEIERRLRDAATGAYRSPSA